MAVCVVLWEWSGTVAAGAVDGVFYYVSRDWGRRDGGDGA